MPPRALFFLTSAVHIDSFVAGRCVNDFCAYFSEPLYRKYLGHSVWNCSLVNQNNEKSTSVQVMAWCNRQHTIACVKCWLRCTLQWRHSGGDNVSNHKPHDCLLNRLFRRISKKTSKLRVTALCAGNSPGTGEFPAQMASNAENVSVWWRHHDFAVWRY